MALGFRRKEIMEGKTEESVILNAPFAFALGKNFKTNKAMIHELGESGANIRIPINEQIPNYHYFFDLPMSFRLPGDKSTWKCTVDVERIYSFDERDRSVYGMEVKFKDLNKEQKEKLMQYLHKVKNARQRPSSPR